MKKLLVALMILAFGVADGYGEEMSLDECIQLTMLMCRHPDGPSQADDLKRLAEEGG